jgi:hypothetical protein
MLIYVLRYPSSAPLAVELLLAVTFSILQLIAGILSIVDGEAATGIVAFVCFAFGT